jgi:hypothetical protein
MSKRTIIILTAIALLVGVVAGGWSVAVIYSHRTDRLIVDYKHHENQIAIGSLTADAAIRVHELRHLRAGNTTNVIAEEELHLEGDLINLELFVADRSDFMSYPSYIDALREVKTYRTEFPYKTDPSVETSVTEVFTLLDVQTNR